MIRALFAMASLAPLVAFADRQADLDAPAQCEIPGTKIHWIVDYCMSTLRGFSKDGVERCLADKEFVGPTVRNGGVGGG